MFYAHRPYTGRVPLIFPTEQVGRHSISHLCRSIVENLDKIVRLGVLPSICWSPIEVEQEFNAVLQVARAAVPWH